MRAAPLACLLAAAIAGPSLAATRVFPVAGFDRIRTSVPFDVRVHTGQRPGVVANGDQEAIDRLEIGVRGGELIVSTKRSSGWSWGWRGARKLTIDVTVPMIRAATLNGPGNLDVDRVRNRDFAINLAGPGNIRIGALDTRMLDATLSGPGDISATGRAERVRIVGNGPGDVRFGQLAARDIDVTLNGPGDVDAMATGTATARLFGPGDIRIAGRPRCTVEKHGPGSVRCG